MATKGRDCLALFEQLEVCAAFTTHIETGISKRTFQKGSTTYNPVGLAIVGMHGDVLELTPFPVPDLCAI